MSSSTGQVQQGSQTLEASTEHGRLRILGFWIFLAGECALFASLIGSYLALHGQTAGGPTAQQVFNLPMTGAATVALLSSSFTCVLAIVGMQRGSRGAVTGGLIATILLGLCFMGFQVFEFVHYYKEGFTFTNSAFGSSFYTLVGFHGGHVTFGIIWLVALLLTTMRRELDGDLASRLYVGGLYWHFVDVVWVIIFTVVYLMGKMG
ncbi:MAG: cytochrome c oxidase subunit 3 [Firmicutes bacterium]|nr:cytochrome c oxidase subunit 3 [Bacillota bacterium]